MAGRRHQNEFALGFRHGLFRLAAEILTAAFIGQFLEHVARERC